MTNVRSHTRSGRSVNSYSRSNPPSPRGPKGEISGEDSFGTVATHDRNGRFTGRMAVTGDGDSTGVRRESNFGRIIGRTRS